MRIKVLFYIFNFIIITNIFALNTELLDILPKNLDVKTIEKIEYPFEMNDDMREWARRIGGKATDNMGKARKIYEGILSRDELNIVYYNNPRLRPMGYKTAKEVYIDRDERGQRFAICGEYTYLYIALAREIGLNVSYVQVEQDKYGKEVNHACVGLFIDGRVVLVDPAYNSFDIKHKKYRFLSDVEAVARHHVDDGFIYSSRGERKKSIEKLKLAVKIAPNFYEAYTWLGDMLYREQRYSEAYVNYSKTVELKPDYIEAQYKKSESLERIGKIDRAYAEYDRISRYNIEGADILFWSAKASYRLRAYNNAIKKLEKAIEIKENYKQAYGELINIYSDLGKKDKINYYSKKLNSLRSGSVTDLYWAGISLYNIERFEEAIDKFEKVISIDRGYEDAYYFIAQSHYELKNYTEAIRNYKRLIKLDKYYIKAYYFLGKTYRKNSEYRNAEDILELATTYDMKNSDAKYWLGMVYSEKGDKRNALEKFREAVWLNGGNTHAQFYLGKLLYQRKDYETAIKRLKKLISLDYEYESGYYYLALSYYKMKDYKQARWIIKRAIAMNRKNIDMNYLMGIIEFKDKNYSKAAKFLKLTLDYGGDFPELYYYLGYAYNNVNKKFEARKYYKMAIEKNPEMARYRNYTKN